MTCSIVTLHYEQPDSLALFLDSIAKQTHPIEEIIVVDDGSSCLLELPSWVRLVRRPRHSRNYPQWSRCVNAGIAAAHGRDVILVWCNWVLESDFILQAKQLLKQNPLVIWCAPIPGVPNNRVVTNPQDGDNRGNYVFRREHWIPWDERFDDLGGIHAVVVWIWQMRQAGRIVRYHPTLRGIHRDGAPYRVPYARGGLELSWAFCEAIIADNTQLATLLYEKNR